MISCNNNKTINNFNLIFQKLIQFFYFINFSKFLFIILIIFLKLEIVNFNLKAIILLYVINLLKKNKINMFFIN